MSLEPQGCPAPVSCACIGENANLIGIIARIRQLSGVGDKPDLAELPEAIETRLQEARSEALEEAARVVGALGDPHSVGSEIMLRRYIAKNGGAA